MQNGENGFSSIGFKLSFSITSQFPARGEPRDHCFCHNLEIFITWLAPWASKINQILQWVGLPERARWRYRDYALFCFATSFYSIPVHKYTKKNLANMQPSSSLFICLIKIEREGIIKFTIMARRLQEAILASRLVNYQYMLLSRVRATTSESLCVINFCDLGNKEN